MTTNQGWTQKEYKQLHDIKVKANSFNIVEAIKILTAQKSILAKKNILKTYETTRRKENKRGIE